MVRAGLVEGKIDAHVICFLLAAGFGQILDSDFQSREASVVARQFSRVETCCFQGLQFVVIVECPHAPLVVKGRVR